MTGTPITETRGTETRGTETGTIAAPIRPER